MTNFYLSSIIRVKDEGGNTMVLKLLSLFSLIVMLLVNYLANALPLGGNTTGNISGKYPTLFTPAGFTFAIWGLIYLLLITFVFMLFLNENKTLTEHKDFILILFILVNLFNALWLFSWHYDQIFISTIVMIALLVILLMIVTRVASNDVLAHATFSIYAGWISVALIANISILITKGNYSIFMNHEYLWFYLILGISFMIGLYMMIRHQNYYYSAVFIWAYIGIASKFLL